MHARIAGALVVVVALLAGVPATYAASSGSSTEGMLSPVLRQALAEEAPNQTPLVESEGSSGAETQPEGEQVSALSTAYSDTWRMRGKPLDTRIYSAPINYQGSDGQWHAISNKLVVAPLGGYENAANSFSLKVPISLGSGMTLSSERGAVTFALLDGREVMPVVEGANAVYREALTATDFAYESTATGVKEIATLRNGEAPEAIRFSVSTAEGLTLRSEPGGSMVVEDEQGGAVFSIPAPVAFPAGGDPEEGRPVPESVESTGSGWTITLDTSVGWLRDELAAGPVVLDPSVSIAGSQNCTITEDTPKAGYCEGPESGVGFDATHKEHHELLQFSMSSIPQAANIFNAKLGMYVQSHSTSTSKAVGVYRVTKPWTTGTTWETYDGTNKWTAAGGDYSSGEDGVVNPSVGASTGWSYWYPTKIVQEWVNTTKAPEQTGRTEGAESYGLIVKDQTDNVTKNLLELDTVHATEHKPFLEVFYEPEGYGSEPQYSTVSTPLTDRSSLNVNLASGNLQVIANDLAIGGTAGLGFSSSHVWNSLDPEVQEYGYWSDSNAIAAQIWADGSVTVVNGTATHFTFLKKSDGSFITPPGIKASLCGEGSPGPACTTLPSGTAYRLTYDQSQDHFDYSSSGALLDEQDQYGNTIKHEKPSAEKQVFTLTHGQKVEELSNSETFISEIKDLAGERNSKYGYEKIEGKTELTAFTDANGKTTKYGYTGTLLTSITDPVGNVTKLAYDGEHRIKEIIRTTNEAHTTGPTTKFVYYELGSAPTPCTTSQKALEVRDPDYETGKTTAHKTVYCANVLDEIEQTVDAEGHTSKAKFNGLGGPTLTTAAAPGESGSGNEISTVYDSTGRIRMCQLDGASTESCMKASERPNTSGLLSSWEYAAGSAAPYAASVGIDTQNNKAQACYGGETQESGRITGGEEEKCASTEGTTGSLKELREPGGGTLKFQAEPNGTLKESTDALGNTTKYKYDAHGNLEAITPPSPTNDPQGETKIVVDADSRPEVITDGAGHKTTLTYDKLDRVTKAVYSGTGTERTIKYEYDADGNTIKREDTTGTTKYKVDALNRLTKEELPSSASNEYGYDGASNLTGFTDSGGKTEYGYNGLNQAVTVKEPGAEKVTTLKYDHDGRLESIEYPSKVKQLYTLNLAGQPEKLTTEGLTGEPTVPTMNYSYKKPYKRGTEEINAPTALIATLSETGRETAYTYDGLNRLTKAITTGTSPSYYSYTLDANGNRTKQAVNLSKAEEGTEATGLERTYYIYNSANELECRENLVPNTTCSGLTTELSHYKYDAAGELTAIEPKHETTGSTFAYNAASQLTKLTPSGETEQALSYLGSGQTALTTIGTTTIQNSGLGITKETTAAGTTYYARLPNGTLIDERTPAGAYNPLYDAQGDIIALVNSSKKVTRTFRYGPYGDNVTTTGTEGPFTFGYKGGYHTIGGNKGPTSIPNGLYHYGERYYDPTTGRWTQEDPTDHAASPVEADRFGFAGDDPMDHSDPSGLKESVDELEENDIKKCVSVGATSAAYAAATGEGAVAAGVGGCAVGAATATGRYFFEEIDEEGGELLEGAGEVGSTIEDVANSL